jgi:CBS domain-containing protein
MKVKVGKVMVSDVEAAGPDVSLRELARRMRELGISFVPIVEGERLVGVITDRDIVLRGVSEAKNSATARARDVMSLEVVCCFEDERVDHARRLMIEHNVRRLPVIGRDHHLVGIVNFADTEGRATPVKKATRATFHKKQEEGDHGDVPQEEDRFLRASA